MSLRLSLVEGLSAISLALVLFTSTNASPLYSSAEVYYRFDTLGSGGEVADSNSNSVDLVALGGSASLIAGVNGNGINLPDGVVLTTTGTGSDDSVLDTTRDTPFTVAAWVKLGTVGHRFFLASKVQREAFGDGDGLELRGWSFDIGAGGKLTAVWRLDNTPVTGTVAQARIIVDSTGTITDTNWHHVALTFDYDESDATRGMRMYIDGLLQGMNPVSTGLASVDDIDLSAPGWPFNVSGRYDGQLNEGGSVDDLAIWKAALSAQDIASLIIPEPSALLLLAMGMVGLMCHRSQFVGAQPITRPSVTEAVPMINHI